VSELLQRVACEIQKRRLLPRGKKILVAVSGGVDSMVLLEVLGSLAPENRWQLAVAHFNHRLRGRASNADAELVRKTAKKLRLEFFGGGADVKQFAAQSKLSVEMAARRLRHEFLARAAREHKISTIALAHHADDQVELFFLRLLRGAGSEGLAGMKWQSPSPVAPGLTLVRPLLGVGKPALLAHARAQKIKYRADASNFSTDILRNRLRHDLLPELRKNYQPGLDGVVMRLMDLVGAESAFVGAAAMAWREEAGGDFLDLPVAVQRKVLQLQLTEAGVPVDFGLVEQLRRNSGHWSSLGSQIFVARTRAGGLEFRRNHGEPFAAEELQVAVGNTNGQAEFSGKKFRWQVTLLKKFSVPAPPPGAEFFDAGKVGDRILLRHWRPGDRFQPIGMPAAVKLQDLFVNAKIPAAKRREVVLATTATGDIFWVEGLRISEHFKLRTQTRRRLHWQWQGRAD
jgi:tRNA(Ile)-lysidine synthase